MKFLLGAVFITCLTGWVGLEPRLAQPAVVFRLTSADTSREAEVRFHIKGEVSVSSASLVMTGDSGRAVTPIELRLSRRGSVSLEGPSAGPDLVFERVSPGAARPPYVARSFRIVVGK